MEHIYYYNSRIHSDQCWEKNIHPLGDSLEKISNLQGVSYRWKADECPEMEFDNEEQIGLIAQEVEQVIPQLVHTDGEGYKSISYEKLTAVLTS